KLLGIATATGQETQSAEAQEAHRGGFGNHGQLIDYRAGIRASREIPVDVLGTGEVCSPVQQVEAAAIKLRIIELVQVSCLTVGRRVVELTQNVANRSGVTSDLRHHVQIAGFIADRLH